MKIPHVRERWDERTSGLFVGTAVILLFVSVAMAAAGFASPDWLDISVSANSITTNTNRGLWQNCVQKGSESKVCESTMGTTEKTWFRVVQGMTILGLAALVIGAGLFLYWSCSYSRYFFNKVLIVACLAIAGILNLAVSITFGVEYDEDFPNYSLKWAFYVYTVSGPLALLAIPCVLLVPAFELQPTGPGQWYQRFTGPRPPPPMPRRYPAPVVAPGLPTLRPPTMAPVTLPPVLPSTTLPKPQSFPSFNAFQPPRPTVATLQTNNNFTWRQNSRA